MFSRRRSDERIVSCNVITNKDGIITKCKYTGRYSTYGNNKEIFYCADHARELLNKVMWELEMLDAELIIKYKKEVEELIYSYGPQEGDN